MVDIPAEFSRIELVCFDVFIADAKYRFSVCYRPPYYDSKARDYAASLIKCLAILVNVNYTEHYFWRPQSS